MWKKAFIVCSYFLQVTITMLEVGGDSAFNEIDTFVVSLSMVSSNHIASYTGKHNISVIDLSYHLVCMNSEDCPITMISPEGMPVYTCEKIVTITGACTFVYVMS